MLKVQFVLVVVSSLVLFHFSWPFQGPSLHPSGRRGCSPLIWPPALASKEGPESGGDQSPGLGSRLLCWSRFRQRGSVWGPSRTAPFHVLRSPSRILTTLPSLPWRAQKSLPRVTRAVQYVHSRVLYIVVDYLMPKSRSCSHFLRAVDLRRQTITTRAVPPSGQQTRAGKQPHPGPFFKLYWKHCNLTPFLC